jgi:hypothetical protein
MAIFFGVVCCCYDALKLASAWGPGGFGRTPVVPGNRVCSNGVLAFVAACDHVGCCCMGTKSHRRIKGFGDICSD